MFMALSCNPGSALYLPGPAQRRLQCQTSPGISSTYVPPTRSVGHTHSHMQRSTSISPPNCSLLTSSGSQCQSHRTTFHPAPPLLSGGGSLSDHGLLATLQAVTASILWSSSRSASLSPSDSIFWAEVRAAQSQPLLRKQDREPGFPGLALSSRYTLTKQLSPTNTLSRPFTQLNPTNWDRCPLVMRDS